jgi:hypothetical protein
LAASRPSVASPTVVGSVRDPAATPMPPERPFFLGDASVRPQQPPRRTSAPAAAEQDYLVAAPSAPAERAPRLGLSSGRGLY